MGFDTCSGEETCEFVWPPKHKSLVEPFRLLPSPFGFLVTTTVTPRMTPIVKDKFIFCQRNLQLSRSVQFYNGSKNVQAQHAMTAFNSKWKYEKLAVVVCVAQTRQIFVISRSCFAELDSKEMHK